MNSTEARFILRARRPDGCDDADPHFEEALKQTKRDPSLAAWLDREQAADAAIAEKLRAVQPPAGLRESILAGARMSRRVPFWRRPQVLTLAACVALVFALSMWPMMSPARRIDQLAAGVLAEVASEAHRSAAPKPRGILQAVLGDPQVRLAGGLPLDFAQLKADGCRTLTIAGREVLEVCFQRGAGFHLYVARRTDFRGDGRAIFQKRGSMTSVAWADDRLAYVLMTGAGEAALMDVL